MKPVIALFKNRRPQVYEVAPSTSVFEALQCLATHGVGALAVMAQGRLVGVVSERDYTRKVALQGRNSRDSTVADIIAEHEQTISQLTHYISG